jgi:uncharacterized integral membrane protein
MTIGEDPGTLPPPQDPGGKDLGDEHSAGTDSHHEGSAPIPVAGQVTHTRISASWTALVVAVFVLVVLVIFIAENTQRSTVNFVGFHGHAPTAVVLLIAAIAGASIVIIVGLARIIQLRKVAKHPKMSA